MWWSAAALREWGPLLTRHGVQAVVVGHMHEYRCDMADATRSCESVPPHGFGIAAATVTFKAPDDLFATHQRINTTGMPLASSSPFTSGFIA